MTACLMGDPNQQGRPAGALVVLHTDGDEGAERLASDALGRLSTLLTGKKPGKEPFPKGPPGHAAADMPEGDVRRLGTVGGRSLLVFRHGHDVLIAWGDDVLSASRDAAASPDRSVAPLCTGWARGKDCPPTRRRRLAGALLASRSRPGHNFAGLADSRARPTGRLVGVDRTGRSPRLDPIFRPSQARPPIPGPACARHVSAAVIGPAQSLPPSGRVRSTL